MVEKAILVMQRFTGLIEKIKLFLKREMYRKISHIFNVAFLFYFLTGLLRLCLLCGWLYLLIGTPPTHIFIICHILPLAPNV